MVSVTVAALGIGGGVLNTENTPEVPIQNESRTETVELGYDFEYRFSVPSFPSNSKLVVLLPDSANTDPISFYSDDSGRRVSFDPIISGREVSFSDIPSGEYHFVYTSFNASAFLQEGDVIVQEES